MTGVCAVVPTYNRKDSLQQCLEALLRQSRRLDEIVVIDNASTDGTEEIIRGRFGGRVSYVRLPENRGSAGGFYVGMKLAWEHRHDWIWCMDNDAIPDHDCLEKLLSAGGPTASPVVAKVCARRDPATGRPYALALMVDLGRCRHWDLISKDWSHWDGKVVCVDGAPWGGLLVDAQAARQTAGQWASMFAWGDDLVFSYELRKLGRILFVADAKLIHPLPCATFPTEEKHGRQRLVAAHSWKIYYGFRNGFLWEKLWFGKWSALVRYALLYVRYVIGILLFDDFRAYRLKMATKAIVDILLDRFDGRVEMDEFQKRYGPK
jgi:GT2 family glycosyltransferase